MIARRGFFGKLAGLLGFAAVPVRVDAEDAESTERAIRREKMAKLGLGPDDVRITYWFETGRCGIKHLRWELDCNGETYGYLITMSEADDIRFIPSLLVTPTEVKVTKAHC